LKPVPFSYRTRFVPDTVALLARQPRSAAFMDHRMPTAAEVPPIDVLIAHHPPAPAYPLEVRGAAEGGISAAGAVPASALRDGLDLADNAGRLPLTPVRVQELATNGGGR
jgi:aerobic carbon-monoxide dehydrogenase large subunit